MKRWVLLEIVRGHEWPSGIVRFHPVDETEGEQLDLLPDRILDTPEAVLEAAARLLEGRLRYSLEGCDAGETVFNAHNGRFEYVVTKSITPCLILDPPKPEQDEYEKWCEDTIDILLKAMDSVSLLGEREELIQAFKRMPRKP